MTAPRDPSYDRLDQRVTAIETSIDKIGQSITSLGEKFDSRSRPQWILIVAALGLVVTILGLVLAGWKAPLDSTIQRQEYDLRQLQQGVVPRVELENHWSSVQRQADDAARRLERLEGAVFSIGQ
jgi:peptidoglycan hydrolase CwlO-like protein